MAMENDALNKINELEANKDIAGLEDIKMTAEAGFEGDIAGAAEQAIARLTEKAAEVSTTSPVQEKQVENLDGSKEELDKRTAPVDEKIEEVKTDTQAKIEEVKGGEAASPEADNEKRQKAINQLVGSIEKQKDERKVKALHFEYGEEIAKKIGKDTLELGEIASLPADQKAEVFDRMVKRSPFVLFENPDLIKQLSPKQLKDLNQSRNLLDYADPQSGGEAVGKLLGTDDFNWLKKSAQKRIQDWPLSFQKNMFTLKYAELFTVRDGKVSGAAYKEYLSGEFNNPAEKLNETKEEFSRTLEKNGVLSLASNLGGESPLRSILKGKAFQANMFREKPLFEQLKNSQKGLKHYIDEGNRASIQNILALYVDMKQDGLLTEEQFKELTTA